MRKTNAYIIIIIYTKQKKKKMKKKKLKPTITERIKLPKQEKADTIPHD